MCLKKVPKHLSQVVQVKRHVLYNMPIVNSGPDKFTMTDEATQCACDFMLFYMNKFYCGLQIKKFRRSC